MTERTCVTTMRQICDNYEMNTVHICTQLLIDANCQVLHGLYKRSGHTEGKRILFVNYNSSGITGALLSDYSRYAQKEYVNNGILNQFDMFRRFTKNVDCGVISLSRLQRLTCAAV